MSQKQNSTSSIPMVQSSRPEQVLALGKRIVEELRLHQSVDTLGKWIAHYLAEKIHAAETTSDATAKAEAERQCMELILRLWERREAFPPQARPLGRLDAALRALIEMSGTQSHIAPRLREEVGEQDGPWFVFARDTEATAKEASAVAFMVGALEADLGAERRWLTESPDLLSKEEEKLLKLLDSWIDRFRIEDPWKESVSLASLEPTVRSRVVVEHLEHMQRKHVETLDRLKAALGLSTSVSEEIPPEGSGASTSDREY